MVQPEIIHGYQSKSNPVLPLLLRNTVKMLKQTMLRLSNDHLTAVTGMGIRWF